MFKILIDKEMTAVFNDNGLDNLNHNDNDNMIGFLINRDGIKELIESMPIRKYYINNHGNREITKEQALFIYDEILKATSVITLTDDEVMAKRNVLTQ